MNYVKDELCSIIKIKFQILIDNNKTNEKSYIVNQNSLNKKNTKLRPNSDNKAQTFSNTINIKIGKVKFFDLTKEFGFVHSNEDDKDCFIHVSKILTPPIVENDIVIFETIKSRKKPDELDAFNVNRQIPVFISNKYISSKSFVVILLDNHITSEFQLTEKFNIGFYYVNLKENRTSYEAIILDSEMISKQDILYFGKILLCKWLTTPKYYNESISKLTGILKTELLLNELKSIYIATVDLMEQEPVVEIYEKISILKGNDSFDEIINLKKSSLNKISYTLWTNSELKKLPKAINQKEVDIWRFEILPSFNWKNLQLFLMRHLNEEGDINQIRESYKYLLDIGWEIQNNNDFELVIDFLRIFIVVFPDIKLTEGCFKSINNGHYIKLFQDGFLMDLTFDRIKQYTDTLSNNNTKAIFIETLPVEYIIKFYSLYSELSSYKEKYLTNILEFEFLKINFLCFDLESNGDKINEFAFLTNIISKSQKDYQNIDEGILELVDEINSGCLIIGQNIKDFDLPILQKYGKSPSKECVWDTLEVEMLLNPQRFSYGLKTNHNACVDTNLTFQLFKNQLSRIIISRQNFDSYLELLPSKAIEIIKEICSNKIWELFDLKHFDSYSNTFFRPYPIHQNISEVTFNKLKESLGVEGNKILIAPEFLWDTLSYQFNLNFYNDIMAFGYILSKEKIDSVLIDEILLKAILHRFIDICSVKGMIPYYQHLPVAIRIKLTEAKAILICVRDNCDFGFKDGLTICCKPNDVGELKNKITLDSNIKVIIVGNELYNLTSKTQLGQDIDFARIFNRLKNEPIWLQLSGGKSFSSIEKRQCELLRIHDFPEYLKNIWLEKIGKGKFKVWCNMNFEACIKDLLPKEVTYINWVDEEIIKGNSYIVRPDSKKSGYIADQKRVNPESLYRKLYWVYQFKLIDSIGSSVNPKVLIVNDELELERLYSYARRKGYFVPDINASLARQLEILHCNESVNKILFTTFQNLSKVISNNYIGSLDFIWDSFLLQEKLQMLKGQADMDPSITTEANNDDFHININTVQKDYDIFSLIKLHKPLIDFYYKMLTDNSAGSNLFLCDTRLSDFYGIEKSLNVNTKNVQMWYKENDYNADKEFATEFFPSIHENSDTNFNIEEAKEILRYIFLTSENGGVPNKWYDYQHPYLNEILPAKKDLLISLPTGAGKSLLFQGPALFRSAFSCKLSIVISPLRALMQDQVDNLWNKGFYSNVEYLSGDKSQAEIKDIYRRVSGGEISLLYITPERFRSRSFENCLLTRLDADNGLEFVVFDEAHCISQWGQEFRPDYLNAARKVADFSSAYQLKKLLFSATISEQVFEEIIILMPGIVTVEGSEKSFNPVSDHIKMDFKHNVVEDERLLEIANYLKAGKLNPELSRAIIFVRSRKKAEECSLIMSDCLKKVFGENCSFSEKVGVFHAGMDTDDRKETYEKFKTGEIILLFATKAFGMGMDIPNIHFVTHYSPPSTFEDFLQEIGRAGRNKIQRENAGFNNTDNPIKTLCLTGANDFSFLKDQLHDSRISWHEIKDIKVIIEEYISRFKILEPDNDTPIAIPFNLYSNEKNTVNEALDNKFRIALHWLERLERIKLGYYTITHLEFESEHIKQLTSKVIDFPDKDIEKVCKAILELTHHLNIENDVIQLSIASLRSISKLSLENLFTALIKSHKAKIIKLLQNVIIEPTKIRSDEIDYCRVHNHKELRYPALQVVFKFAYIIMNSVALSSSKFFNGDELDQMLIEAIDETIDKNEYSNILPWSKKDKQDAQIKEYERYFKDIIIKRSKHAFTIIRLLGKTKHETKMEKVTDGLKRVSIKQSVFNGYHKKEEWTAKIQQLETDTIKMLDIISKSYFDENIKSFNWADIISEMGVKCNFQYLSDMLFTLSVLGYTKTGGLMASGIEMYLTSVENINELDLLSDDKKIYDEFEKTRKVRELKLIALEVLANLNNNKSKVQSDIKMNEDTFIKSYFACNSLESLLQLLQDNLLPNDPLLIKWRGDAIKTEEDRLNKEQRKVYDAEINQHINVMAGPGSGKTHTLTLRVAKLVHHIGTMPEEIMVLAYNRAVVSELKERLGKLFNNLGYGNLSKRIKIFTFHGLAKKYCPEDVKGKPFDEWENILLKKLINSPGSIMNQLGPLKHILVDEFQDINNVRIKLLKRLNQLTDSYLFIIGDPNQSIYGFERLNDGGSLNPWPYYQDFNKIFNPHFFELYDNHRSFPKILEIASQILSLPEEHKHLIPRPTRVPDDHFIDNYAEIVDRTQQRINWWSKIEILLQEKVGEKQRPYKQIAILFRTNNEVYRGFQKVKGLNIPNIRIRIQGSLPYEFTRIRECFAIILYLQSNKGFKIPITFRKTFNSFIKQLVTQNPNWNHFYIRVIHALVLEFLEEQDDDLIFDNLLDFITEITYRDDGQLYKIYEKHIDKVSDGNNETEIVLTTMHKVKGLEFDAVIIPPSFSSLPININDEMTSEELTDHLDEEKRLAFVAYTRARYRLIVFQHNRELALKNNQVYRIPENANTSLGIPVQPAIKKLKIGWAAKAFNFNGGVNNYINTSIKSGDFVFVRRRVVPNNGNHFIVHELCKENTNRPISELNSNLNIFGTYSVVSGYVVNEILAWTYEDTCKFDSENNTKFANDWCQEAINQGYIYLVDFAGYGVPMDNV